METEAEAEILRVLLSDLGAALDLPNSKHAVRKARAAYLTAKRNLTRAKELGHARLVD